MSAVFRLLPNTMLVTSLILVGCTTEGLDRPSSTGQSRRSLDSDLGEICSGLGETTLVRADYISEDVTDDYACRGWLAEKEMYLCGAYYYFNRATSLSTIGETWPARLAHFRNAVEHILDVILDTQDVENGFWQKGYLEKEIVQPGNCGGEPDIRVPLLYYRRMKMQAVELYKTIAKHYSFSLRAEADASRSVSGNTAEYSDNVWGTPDSDGPSLLEVKGHRALDVGFLLGADVAYLNKIVRRAGEPEITDFSEACRPPRNG